MALVMPFGKHKGSPISAVPTPYVRWSLTQDWLAQPTRRWLEEELELRRELARLRHLPSGSGLVLQPSDAQLLRSMVEAGRKALLPRSHPGTVKRLNHISRRLRAQLDSIVERAS
ncbi:MAG: DUF3820 family protein [Acidobacteriia bacterium]|nr:DUF3820 family protein [Terriglobia bacterium]